MMKKIKVLIVDDNEEICKMLKNSLDRYVDVEVLAICYSDQDELKLIESLKPDVVITDLVRNGRDSGLEIIKIIKKKEESPKFLVFTAKDCNAEYTEIIDAYIKKPIENFDVIYKELKKIK